MRRPGKADRPFSSHNEVLAGIDMAMALAGLGEVGAAALGGEVLTAVGPRPVSPARSRLGDLDRALTARFPDAGAVRDFHDRYQNLSGAR